MRKVLLTSVATFVGLHAGTAHAQDGPAVDPAETTQPEAEAQSEDVGLNEVIVTARRRNESLLETPVAVTAFDAEELERRGITEISEIAQSTPSLVFESTAGNSSDARIFIRAVGNANPNVTAEQGVGIYIDGIYYGRSQGALIDNVDISSLEILRGPQGTLFGRNTIGGAINITTTRPSTDAIGASVEATYASFNRFRARAAFNVPLGDTVAIRAAILRDVDDGYSVNDVDGRELDNRDVLGLQAALRVQIFDNLTWDSSVFYSDDRGNGRAYQCVQHAANPVLGAAFPPACAATNANGIRHTRSNEILTGYVSTFAASSTLAWDIGQTGIFDDLTVKALVGYQTTDSRRTIEFDATSLDGIVSEDIDRRTKQVSGELQILGSAADGRLDFVLGAYVDSERTPGTGERYTGVYSFLDNILPRPLNTIQRLHLLNDSKALYAQVTFDISSVLSLTGGIRYTDETKGFDLEKFFSRDNARLVPVGPLTADGQFISSYQELTPMGSVQLNAPDSWLNGFLNQGMAYFTYSRGFKGGGFNGNGDTVTGNLTSYSPEIVDNYEFGLKFAIADRQVIGSIAIYDMEYTDIQLAVQGTNEVGSPVSSIFNAGAATIRGVEFELQGRLARTLRWSLNAEVTDAYFTRFDDLGRDRSNEPVNYVPDYRVSASLENEFSLGGNITVTPRVQVTLTGERWLVTDVNPAIREVGRVGETSNVDASLRVQFGENTSLTLYGKNIFDEAYVNDVLSVGFVSLVYYNEPATFGATLRQRF